MTEATCISPGVYPAALTRGKRYTILAVNPENGNLKIKGDNGRVRWFSAIYSDLANGPAPTIVTMRIEVLPVMDQDYLDRQWAGEDVVYPIATEPIAPTWSGPSTIATPPTTPKMTRS